MVRNEQLIDPTASAVIGDSAPAPCHVGNQVLYNLAMIHSSEPLSSVRSYGINSAVARLGGISRLVSSRLIARRRRWWQSRCGRSIDFTVQCRGRPALYFTTDSPSVLFYAVSAERLHVFRCVMQLPRDAVVLCNDCAAREYVREPR